MCLSLSLSLCLFLSLCLSSVYHTQPGSVFVKQTNNRTSLSLNTAAVLARRIYLFPWKRILPWLRQVLGLGRCSCRLLFVTPALCEPLGLEPPGSGPAVGSGEKGD